jgi:hypothetical protein
MGKEPDMTLNEKVERDLRRLDHDGSLLLQDPEVWVLKITRRGRGWLVSRREYDEDELAFEVVTNDRNYVREELRMFHSNLEQLLSL